MLERILWLGVVPSLFYLVAFLVLTFPLIGSFSTHIFADAGDGLQNVWNIWWINKALTELHQLPWHTPELHHPGGTSLLAQTLNPFNGFVATPLLRFFSLIEAHNLMVIFPFVVGGLNTFLLARSITGSYLGSLAAGYIFTFSSYHFAHAEGHMQLVSLEWIPLFLLLWRELLDRPTHPRAIGAALALFLVILCDYYYFFYCVITGGIFVVEWAIRLRKPWFLLAPETRGPILTFIYFSLATSGFLAISLLLLSRTDPLMGAHDPLKFSLDPFALLIPGGHWRFHELTEFHWGTLPGNIHEHNVYFGTALMIVVVLGWLMRRRPGMPALGVWYFLMLLFAVLSLGPVLNTWGQVYPSIPLPYAALEKVFPPLEMSGTPVRMMVIALLSASIVAAAVFQQLARKSQGSRYLAAALAAGIVFEFLPKPMPQTRLEPPPYIRILMDAPRGDAVLDWASTPSIALYYQTMYDLPMALGFISRVPDSVDVEDQKIYRILQERTYDRLCKDHDVRYFLAKADEVPPLPEPTLTLFDDDEVRLFDLGGGSPCR